MTRQATGVWLAPLLAAIIAIAALCWLGVWQLQRRSEKETLLSAIAQRSVPPARPLWPQGAWAGLDPPSILFTRVTVSGRFLAQPDFRLFALLDEAPGRRPAEAGWFILTPFDVAGGGRVLVNRGFVALAATSPPPPSGTIEIEGLIRPPETAGLFSASDDPAKNAWYSRDLAKMAQAGNLGAVAPFTIDLVRAAGDGLHIQARPPNLPNRHLEYAITWFALAGVLAIVSSLFIIARLKRRPG